MPIIYASLQPSFSKLPVGDILSQAITSQPPSLFPCDIHSPLILFPDTMATYCIVVGVVLAALTLIGLIASYCGWHKMLKIVSRFKRYKICTSNRIALPTNVSLPACQYAIILGVLLVVQIIVVAVVFSNPTKYANAIVSSTEALLKSYGNEGEAGNASTAIWTVLMEVRVCDQLVCPVCLKWNQVIAHDIFAFPNRPSLNAVVWMATRTSVCSRHLVSFRL